MKRSAIFPAWVGILQGPAPISRSKSPRSARSAVPGVTRKNRSIWGGDVGLRQLWVGARLSSIRKSE